jgi:glucose uptake protein GlcU
MDNFLLKLAVTLVGDPSGSINIPSLTGAQVLQNGLNIAYFLAGTIAVIVIIVGGITYVTAAGNSSNITKAKNMLLYSVVGLVIVIAAYAITNFVILRFN